MQIKLFVMKIRSWLLFSGLVLLTSCLKQAQPLNTVSGTDVWQDSTLMDAYLADVYSEMSFLHNSSIPLSNSSTAIISMRR
jgi:hypothetical protein